MEVVNDLNLEATELRLGLPGSCSTSTKDDDHNQTSSSSTTTITTKSNKRILPDDMKEESGSSRQNSRTKAKVVGWPPVRSYRKNSIQEKKMISDNQEGEAGGLYIKVSMDGAPFLRKIDVKVYEGYPELLKALQNMFKFKVGKYCESEGYNGSEFVPTYEDKDGDWMLVGDVPWDMFVSTCKKLRIMKRSEVRGMGSGNTQIM